MKTPVRTAQRKKFALVCGFRSFCPSWWEECGQARLLNSGRPEREQEMLATTWLCPFPFSFHLGSQHMGWCPLMRARSSLPSASPLWKPSALHHLPGNSKTSKIDLDNQPPHWAYWLLIRVTQMWPRVCSSKTGVSRPQTVTGDTCILLYREGGVSVVCSF